MIFLIISFKILPYLLTNENYNQNSEISPLFPVVVLNENSPHLIRWKDYSEKLIAFSPKQEEKIIINKHEYFLIKQINNFVQVDLYTDDYKFYASYEIDRGLIKPSKFHYSGVFILFYALIAAFILTTLTNLLINRFCYKLQHCINSKDK